MQLTELLTLTEAKQKVPRNSLWEPLLWLLRVFVKVETRDFRYLLKVAFFQKVQCVFHIAKINIPNHYPELEIWISCFLFLAGNLNFKVRIVIWNNFFFDIWRFDKPIALSEKKPPLVLVLFYQFYSDYFWPCCVLHRD